MLLAEPACQDDWSVAGELGGKPVGQCVGVVLWLSVCRWWLWLLCQRCGPMPSWPPSSMVPPSAVRGDGGGVRGCDCMPVIVLFVCVWHNPLPSTCASPIFHLPSSLHPPAPSPALCCVHCLFPLYPVPCFARPPPYLARPSFDPANQVLPTL